MLFFTQRARLRLPRWSCPDDSSIDFFNVDHLVGTVIAHGKATLNELQTVYTIEDLHNLYEIIAVTKYNEFLAIDNANKKAKR